MKKALLKAFSVFFATALLTIAVSFGVSASDSGESVEIHTNTLSRYKIIFAAADDITSDTDLAVSLSERISDLGIYVPFSADVLERESAYEILLGETNRELSQELTSTARRRSADGSLVWIIAYRDGKIAYVASSDEAFRRGMDDMLAIVGENGIVLEDGEEQIFILSREEYEEELREEEERLEAEKEAARLELIEELRKTSASFDMELFYSVNTSHAYNQPASEGGKQDNYPTISYGQKIRITDYVQLPEDAFPDPYYYPVGEHPYVYFRDYQLDDIRRVMESEEYAELAKKFWDLANTENFTGIMPDKISNKGNHYQYDTTVIAIIEAKAFAYLLTGDEQYGLEAIIGAKNAMLTINYILDLHIDPHRGALHLIEAITRVYDWCYDLMTDLDKEQIILGFQNRLCASLEYNIFRVGQGLATSIPFINAVSGHGMGSLFLVKMFNFALVTYYENPNMWDYVGGKYFDMNVPVFSAMYTDGYATQGTANYAENKYNNPLISAFTLNNATGFYPEYFYMPGAYLTAYHFASSIAPNKRYFLTGDGPRSAEGVAPSYAHFLLAASLFEDEELYLIAKMYAKEFTSYSSDITFYSTAPIIFILSSVFEDSVFSGAGELSESLPLIQYFSSPNGFMSARNSWDENGAATFMKIGERTMANHDIADHGTFQIYYKGMLAGTSGTYNKYGSYVHKYYLQATVSSNGVLIFNPENADSEPVYGKNADGSTNKNEIINHQKYYYSGSQRQLGETNSLDTWLTDKYTMATVNGAEYEYNIDGSARYAYISGDLTQAYEADQATYVGRRMLTVYTGDPDVPMLFLVFDKITSIKENFTKTFLLHTVKEPEISEDGKSATVTGALGGKLSVNLVSGADRITKIGGAGQAYWINGKNCVDEYAPDDNASRIWGRLEISMTGKLTDNLLTAMYVTDDVANGSVEVESIETDGASSGVKLGNTVAVFSHTENGHFGEVSFNSGEKGLLNYYVSGLYPGNWEVVFDDFITVRLWVHDGSDLLTFVGPAGEVKVHPIGDMPTGKIKYDSNGGTVPDDAPLLIYKDTEVILPDAVAEGSTFAGWYTTPTFDEGTKVESLNGSEYSGIVRLYAKWANFIIASADFTKDELSFSTGSTKNAYGISFLAKDKVGASFKTVEENGERFLRWEKGENDSLIDVTASSSGKALGDYDDGLASYEVSLAKDGDNPIIHGHIRISAKSPVTGKNIGHIYVITITKTGDVKLGQSGPVLFNLNDGERHDLQIVLDFNEEEIYLYDSGEVIATYELTVPKIDVDNDGVADDVPVREWYNYIKNYSLYWYSNSVNNGQSLRIYTLKVSTGNIFEPI